MIIKNKKSLLLSMGFILIMSAGSARADTLIDDFTEPSPGPEIATDTVDDGSPVVVGPTVASNALGGTRTLSVDYSDTVGFGGSIDGTASIERAAGALTATVDVTSIRGFSFMTGVSYVQWDGGGSGLGLNLFTLGDRFEYTIAAETLEGFDTLSIEVDKDVSNDGIDEDSVSVFSSVGTHEIPFSAFDSDILENAAAIRFIFNLLDSTAGSPESITMNDFRITGVPIPEPSTYALLGGMLALVGYKRRVGQLNAE